MISQAPPTLVSLFEALQDGLEAELRGNRAVLAHPTTKGNASELKWRAMLTAHLPTRYDVASASVIDANGRSSDQIDLVIFDRQYTPKLFNRDGALYLPAESVYAAIEVKQDLTKANIDYASAKIASVRRLRRTSVQIRHAGGNFAAVIPKPIIGGILCLNSEWTPAFGEPFRRTLAALSREGRIDVGCAVKDGAFTFDAKKLVASPARVALASLFVSLFAKLQQIGTVPAIDLAAYARNALTWTSSKKPAEKSGLPRGGRGRRLGTR